MTTDRPAGVIFSDLDGTFLDQRYTPALDAERFALATGAWRVVWATSRTVEELLHLQELLGHEEDAIAENGGVLVTRSEDTAHALGRAESIGNAWITRLASPHSATESMVREIMVEARVPFRTLQDYTTEELAQRAHYDTAHALRAKERRASVLLSDIDLLDPKVRGAIDMLRNSGCFVAHGGHWISVVHGANKGTAARAWLARPWADHAVEARTVVAIGNSENDESLLSMADVKFVVSNPSSGHEPSLRSVQGARLLQREGTAGWIEMLDTLRVMAER